MLAQYGIHQEQSDYRIHVGVASQIAYVFPTTAGVAAIQSGKYPKAPAYTGNVQTADGYLVPPAAIEGCQEIAIPERTLRMARFQAWDTPTEKGLKAVRVAEEMLRLGLIPLAMGSVPVERYDLQVSGVDLIVTSRLRIQVKCDWKAGRNLYLQVAEANPFQLY